MTAIMEETDEDLAMQYAIRSRANASLAILEKAFIRNGSGRYFVLRTSEVDLQERVGKMESHESRC
jgi:hypothetical protein